MNFSSFSLLGLCMILFASAHAQSDDAGWTLIREADGIQVFTRPHGEGLVDDVKGVVVISGNIDSAFKILSDIPTFSATDPVVVETKIIETINENEYYIWQLGKMPFFMSDRDIVSKISFNRTAKGGYMLASKTYPDFIPEKPKLVRLRDITMVVSLRPIAAGTFEMQYLLTVGDSYGAVALAASNKAVVESTYERLKRMRELTIDKPIADQ